MAAEEYGVALAYSNTQFKRRIPVVVSGVVSFEDFFEELQGRDLPRKHNLVRRVNKFYALQQVFDDVSHYLAAHEVISISQPIDIRKDVENAYLKILTTLTRTQLRQLSGRTKYLVMREIEGYNKQTKQWEVLPFTASFIWEVKRTIGSETQLISAVNGEFYRLLDIAKILASAEYERIKLSSGVHVIEQIRANPKDFAQILKVTWNCPPVDAYTGFDVGPPAVVVRNSDDAQSDYWYFKNGDKLNFAPLAKFCRGDQDESHILPCKKSNKTNPFGQVMMGSAGEQCVMCRGDFECTQCLYRKPLCNGYNVICGNLDFAGGICCGLFAIYVTRFGNELKVGTSIMSNVIGRLLEQGANSALICYPVEGIMNTYIIEGEIKKYLRKRLPNLMQFGIKSVYTRAPPGLEKLKDFLQDWNRMDRPLLEEVNNLLLDATLTVEDHRISMAEPTRVICNFLNNYSKPPDTLEKKLLRSQSLFGVARGSIVGYRGSFVFLDSGTVIDFRELSGYVVRGSVGGA